ncbi:hypothetical protein [Desulfosarcina ovata]|uniref:Uncharacterized protein n=2 Tax=Desulfosarcina ovata TaxID=83564 RepID=A0A5K8AAV9_9BACT|nr:hypothetical protein [Desulfosarcina ovata]BBO82414.1 hypothetical protein DSCO28_29800 [Desulfosarcina ovata subsp. sediminis]BBO89618.1 hypothetical protein DSCOOX_27980 [Desulfosarcina ovata subsp. ovata]
MDQKEMVKQVLDFNHATFNNSFNALVLLQDQFERVAQTVLSQTGWLPEEGHEAINEWVNNYKAGRDQFKTYVDDNYTNMETFFAG